MATKMPVPIQFRLPEGWLPARLAEFDATGVAFAAVHTQPAADFTANITIDGEYRPDAATLTELADDSVERLREVAESVVVAHRRGAGSADAPALTQQLTFSAVVGDARHNLVQSQVYLSMVDIEEPHRRVVIRLTLTATGAQYDHVLGDFQDFVRTVRSDTEVEA
ncbi:hypothetical protein LKL35_35190 [Streptomyces sp. ET3-23]|uniref:hypothetical protein n=1 Tax=Streptomyces sp. ET3-23 TaxID=2885643 RepID=UPI001D127BFC|nr:hypothetical protein [Streptomyces sp. ET3-23]MCC2280612.1 hypothetical protein [Streptomyces sp. ET3-23]